MRNIKLLSAAMLCSMSISAQAETIEWTGTVASAGCTVSAIQGGTIVDAGSNTFSSSTADGGAPVSFQIDTTDNLHKLTISDPTIMLGGTTPVTMADGTAATYQISEATTLGLSDQPYSVQVDLTSAATYNFEINYSDATVGAMQSGNYAVNAVITCAP